MTDRQQSIFDFICTFIYEHGYPPTVREIAHEHGITSPNGVSGHLKSLENMGLIKRSRSLSRSISVVGGIKGFGRCPTCGAKLKKPKSKKKA